MTPLRKLSSCCTLAASLVLAAVVGVCSAQFNELPNAYSQPELNGLGAYQPVINNSVDELYRYNETLPLGGLFAKGFTRTLTLMGGVNFANSLDTTGFNVNPEDGVPFFPNVFQDPDNGYAISFAFGRRHSYKLRSEIELAIRENDLASSTNSPAQDSTITAYSVMKNFIHDFHNRGRFTPYVGAGLGWSYLELEDNGIDEGTGAFSYQAIGGVAMEVSRAADFVVEYRFLGTSEVELNDSLPISYEAHNIFLGLKLEY